VVNLGFQPNQSITSPPVQVLLASSVNNTGVDSACTTSVGSAVACFFESFVVVAVNVIRAIFIAFFTVVIAPLLQAILTIQPHQAGFAQVILQGWVVIRNLMNVIFILAMIIMALATLLRVGETYNYKHLMMEIILAALLVNFSLVIAQGILSIADTFQAQFLPINSNGDVIGKLAAVLIGNPFSTQSADIWKLTGTVSGIVSSVFGLVLAFAALLVFGAICAFLLIRIVALWVLLMVSPVGYAFMALPLTHHEATKWWKTFFQYAFFTPIMALFLHLCALILDAQRTYVQSDAVSKTFGASSGFNQANLAGFIANLLTNLLVLGCLYATLEIAKEFSIFGAGAVINYAEKGLHQGYHVSRDFLAKRKYNATAGWARGNRFQRAMFTLANPGLRAQEYMKASHHELEEAKSKAIGAASYLEEKRRTHGGDNRADVNAQRKIESSREVHFADNNQQQNLEELETMEHSSGHVADKIGLMRVMLANGQFKQNISQRIKEAGIGNGEFNAQNVGAYMRQVLGDSEQAKRFMAVDLTKRAKDAGMYEAMNAYVVGTGKNKGKYLSGDETISMAALDDNGQPVISGAARDVLSANGATQATRQQLALIETINSVDVEKRGEIKLNVENYFDANSAHMDAANKAIIRMVAAGGGDTARGQSSGQLGKFLMTTKVNRTNGTLIFDSELQAQRFRELYDNPDMKDYINVAYARAVGLTRPQDQVLTGVGYTYNDQTGAAQIGVLGGNGVDRIKAGINGHDITFAATANDPNNVITFLHKPDVVMAP